MHFLKSKAWNKIFLMFKRSQRFIGLGEEAVVFYIYFLLLEHLTINVSNNLLVTVRKQVPRILKLKSKPF